MQAYTISIKNFLSDSLTDDRDLDINNMVTIESIGLIISLKIGIKVKQIVGTNFVLIFNKLVFAINDYKSYS